jgi:hypothetical protein
MNELIVLRLAGENKLTIVDRNNGKVEIVDPGDLGLGDNDLPRGLIGVDVAYVFGAEFQIESRHRTQAA